MMENNPSVQSDQGLSMKQEAITSTFFMLGYE